MYFTYTLDDKGNFVVKDSRVQDVNYLISHYQYDGNTEHIKTYYGDTLLEGTVNLYKDNLGRVDSIRAEKINPDGSIANWQTYQYVYSGKSVTKAVWNSNYADNVFHYYDYIYKGTQLQSISMDGKTILSFQFKPNTPSAAGDFFWEESNIFVPTCFYEPVADNRYSAIVYPVQGQNLCDSIAWKYGLYVGCTYTYDQSKHLTEFYSLDGTFDYTWSCLNYSGSLR